MENIKSPLNILILIGLICQGMTWNNNYGLIIFCSLWLILILFKFAKINFKESYEIAILLTAFFFFYLYSGNNLFEKCIALGNGLAVLQLIRLTCKLDFRKKILAFAMATTQIAIGTQTFLDYSFILILIALIIIIPKFFYLVNYYEYREEFEHRNKFLILKHKFEYLFVIIFSSLFFLFFPRLTFKTNNNFFKDSFNVNDSITLTKPQLQTSLKSVSEEDLDRDLLLFQVHADNLTYFRMLSMDKFDGDLWSINTYGYLFKRNFRWRRFYLNDYSYRKVDVKYENFKSRFIPTDGEVYYVEGNFFEDPILSKINNLAIPRNINRKNKTYEYWCNTAPENESLNSKAIDILTKLPTVSNNLKTWLNNIVKSYNSKYDKAIAIQNYLKANFKYELGAPELDKKYPIEDFIFKEKKGHCERFASAMAVLLRMLDIPSKVTVGYLALEKNDIGNYYNIRAGDAHAWTEAYFEGKGWVIFDATPAGNTSNFRKITSSRFANISDYIEYIWYSKIVNMSHGEQLKFFGYLVQGAKFIVKFISSYFIILLIAFSSVFLFLIFYKMFRDKSVNLNFSFTTRKKRGKKLEHFYGRMLSILSKHNIKKHESTTPNEFLAELKKLNLNHFTEIQFLTEIFCDYKYGKEEISPEQLIEVEKNINLLKKELSYK